MKRALVTGVAGQDGYYLSRFLLDRGYEVIGSGRPGTFGDHRGHELRELGVRIVEIDLLDRADTHRAISTLRPDEVYNLAGHSYIPASWDDPAAAIRITAWPVIHLLDAIRTEAPSIRFYQSSTSEIFGSTTIWPQDEDTPFAPVNPYAAAKLFAHQLVILYRQHYGLFAASGILYNHESPRRLPIFVTRKVTEAACQIKAGMRSELLLGDLEVTRDWGYAGDFVDAMWRMLQVDTPRDFVIGTGVTHTVRDLCRTAFDAVGLDYRNYVRVDPTLLRPGQPTQLLANPARAAEHLDWRPVTPFDQLIGMMVNADLKRLNAAAAEQVIES